MNKKKVLLIIIPIIVIVIGYFLFSSSGTAKEHIKIGKVLEFYGKVELKKGKENKVFNVFENMTFTQGDTVLTGPSSLIKLAFDVDKEVTVTSNTELVISQLVESVKAKSGKTNLDLQGGKVKVKIDKKLEGESEFKVRTPNAIMGVMGTEFYVYYNGQETWVGTVEGVVSVQVIGEDEDPITVEANQSVLIGDQGSSGVTEMDMEQLRLFTEDDNEGATEGTQGEGNTDSEEGVASEASDADRGEEASEEIVSVNFPERRRTNKSNSVQEEREMVRRPVAEKSNEENRPIEELPVDPPPIPEPENPPVVEEEVPPVDGEDNPPVGEEEFPPEDGEDIPPVDVEESPPEEEEEVPTIDEEEPPPGNGGSVPPIDWGGTPPEDKEEPPGGCEGISPGEDCEEIPPGGCEGILPGEDCEEIPSGGCESISPGEDCEEIPPGGCEGMSSGEECGDVLPDDGGGDTSAGENPDGSGDPSVEGRIEDDESSNP